MGFTQVEGAGLWGRKAAELRAALDAAGLTTVSAHMDFERLRDDLPGALTEAKALGASWVVCPWIPHKGDAFTREDTLKAADTFNKIGKGASSAGLHFSLSLPWIRVRPVEGRHAVRHAGGQHGCRERDVPDRCLPLLSRRRRSGASHHAVHGPRVKSLHLKDLKKGWTVVSGKAIAPPEADVPVGTGQLDMPAILKRGSHGGRGDVLHRGREQRAALAHPSECQLSQSPEGVRAKGRPFPSPRSQNEVAVSSSECRPAQRRAEE